VQGEADHVPVVTAEVRWKPGAQTTHEAIDAAWDAVAHAVAAADVRFLPFDSQSSNCPRQRWQESDGAQQDHL